MSSLRGKSIIALEQLSKDQIDRLVDLAEIFRLNGIPAARPGKRVCGLFFNPSLRTRTALELSTAMLGGIPVCHDVGGNVWSLEYRDGAVMDGNKTEHVKDAIGMFLSGVVDAIGVRAFAEPTSPWDEVKTDPVISAIAKISEVPVINLESALWHPMQGLADLQTMKRRMPGPAGDRKVVLSWAWHPKPLPMAVPNSFLLAAAGAGYRVTVAHPKGFDLAPEVMAQAKTLSDARGGSLTLTHDMDEACKDAHVVYAKSWASYRFYGNVAGDAEARKDLRSWIVDERRQKLGAGPTGSGFMHCLPVRRNCIVSDAVIDGPNSWVAEQARNRLFTQAAVLHEML